MGSSKLVDLADQYIIYTDGSVMMDRKRYGIGGVVKSPGGEENVYEFSERVEEAHGSGSVEYLAAIHAVQWCLDNGIRDVQMYTDCMLMVRQMNGEWMARTPHIRVLWEQLTDLVGQLNSWEMEHIPRKKNKEADFLSGEATQRSSNIRYANEVRRQAKRQLKDEELREVELQKIRQSLEEEERKRQAEQEKVRKARRRARAKRRQETRDLTPENLDVLKTFRRGRDQFKKRSG